MHTDGLLDTDQEGEEELIKGMKLGQDKFIKKKKTDQCQEAPDQKEHPLEVYSGKEGALGKSMGYHGDLNSGEAQTVA